MAKLEAIQPETVQAACDGKFAEFAGTLTALQDAYFAANKRYFQGLSTHAVLPKDGESKVADRLDEKPGQQAESWRAFGLDPGSLPFALAIDVYDGPNGMGWSARLTMEIEGVPYVRLIGSGKESITQEWKRCPRNVADVEVRDGDSR